MTDRMYVPCSGQTAIMYVPPAEEEAYMRVMYGQPAKAEAQIPESIEEMYQNLMFSAPPIRKPPEVPEVQYIGDAMLPVKDLRQMEMENETRKIREHVKELMHPKKQHWWQRL